MLQRPALMMKNEFDWALMPSLFSANNKQLLEFYMVPQLKPYITSDLKTIVHICWFDWTWCQLVAGFLRHPWLVGHFVLQMLSCMQSLGCQTAIKWLTNFLMVWAKWCISNFIHGNIECKETTRCDVAQSASPYAALWLHSRLCIDAQKYWAFQSHPIWTLGNEDPSR